MAKTPRTLQTPATPRVFSTAAVIAAATIFGLTYSLSAPLIALDLDARGYSETFIGFNANPELWVAGVLLIAPAEATAWTPGLVLDYARALRVAINPPPLGIVTLTALTRKRLPRDQGTPPVYRAHPGAGRGRARGERCQGRCRGRQRRSQEPLRRARRPGETRPAGCRVN